MMWIYDCKSRLTKLQKAALLWLTVFTVACLVNSVLGICLGVYRENWFAIAFLLPLIHCCSVWAVLAFRDFWPRRKLFADDSEYLRERYPGIWRKLRPWDGLPISSLRGIVFLARTYGDSADEKLNGIRFNWLVFAVLRVWTFYLVIVVWILNIILQFLVDVWSR